MQINQTETTTNQINQINQINQVNLTQGKSVSSIVLEKLDKQNKIKMTNKFNICSSICWSSRNFKVTDEGGNLLFSAEQLGNSCCESGYILAYKLPSNQIFGSLGYKLSYCTYCCTCYCSCSCCGCYCRDCCLIPLFDVRFLNSKEEAAYISGGTYVGTVQIPLNCCIRFFGNCGFPLKFNYSNAGSRFYLRSFCCQCFCCEIRFEIGSYQINQTVGEVIWHLPCFSCEESFDVTFPLDATPIEKLMIISTLFNIEYESTYSRCCKPLPIRTNKYKTVHGIDKDYK